MMTGTCDGMMGGVMGGWMVVMMVLWGLFTLLALVLLVLAIIWLWRQVFGNAGRPKGDPALAILRERYARGEASREEYERTRQDLG